MITRKTLVLVYDGMYWLSGVFTLIEKMMADNFDELEMILTDSTPSRARLIIFLLSCVNEFQDGITRLHKGLKDLHAVRGWN